MDEKESTSREHSRARRPQPPLDYSALEAAALEYLGRYATSSANLGRVLARRVERHRIRHHIESPDAEALIARVVRECVGHGYVNDDRYAKDKAVQLWRGGRSRRYIEGYLASKGISRELASAAVSHAHKEEGGDDFGAALTYAKRRRFGPFRKDLSEPLSRERQEKQLAALARQGFSYAIARRIISAETPAGLSDS